MIVFDTDVISCIMGPSPPLGLIRRVADIDPDDQATTTITVGELVRGALRARSPGQLLAVLRSRDRRHLPPARGGPGHRRDPAVRSDSGPSRRELDELARIRPVPTTHVSPHPVPVPERALLQACKSLLESIRWIGKQGVPVHPGTGNAMTAIPTHGDGRGPHYSRGSHCGWSQPAGR
jgi:hypothetical protein